MRATSDRIAERLPGVRPDPALVAFLALGLALRLAWALYAARRPEALGDPFSYLTHAEEIARGDGYRTFRVDRPGDPTAYYPVGYPAILGGAIWLVHLAPGSLDTMGIAIGLNVVLGVATVWLVYDLTRRLVDRSAARIAAALTAVFPGLVLYTATVHLETVFTFLVVLVAWVLLARPWTSDPPTLGHLVLVGALMAIATYVRPIVVVFLPLLALLWKRSGLLWSAALRSTGIVLAVVLVALAPWTIRNAVRMDAFVVLSTNTGDNLCVGHHAESRGHYHELFDFCWDPTDESDEVARDRANTRRALRYGIEHPVREVELLARKTYYLFEHDHEAVYAVESYGEDPFLSNAERRALKVLASGFYYVVLLLALAGLVPALRRGDLRRRVLLVWTGVLLATPLVFFGGARFHVPALPFLAFLAALALSALSGWSRARRSSVRASSAGARGS